MDIDAMTKAELAYELERLQRRETRADDAVERLRERVVLASGGLEEAEAEVKSLRAENETLSHYADIRDREVERLRAERDYYKRLFEHYAALKGGK
jgi:chromosome segregation ATPase